MQEPNPQEEMLAAERDVQARLGDRPLDFDANRAISNIYRAAAAVRRQAERNLLSEYGLSWGGFTILWVLWVWGEMETAQLANECDLAKGTLTGMLTTLEKRDLVERRRSESDGRRVLVSATDTGADVIDELFPRFNAVEVDLVDGLTADESRELARLLRIVITNATDADAD
jgi:DNA-binding MarR family transcriptional regulator